MKYSEVSVGLSTPSTAYMDKGTSTGDSSTYSPGSEINNGASHDHLGLNGLHPALAWANSEGWERFLVEYCTYAIIWSYILMLNLSVSDNIAPEMVVIDDSHNGWRHQILPLTWLDGLVKKAVLAVSAFHLSGKTDCHGIFKDLANPSKLYSEAIHELQNRKNLDQYGHQTKRLIILSIIVLLVAVMVTGCSDFPILFQLLQSALEAIGGEDGLGSDELSEFALRQIHK